MQSIFRVGIKKSIDQFKYAFIRCQFCILTQIIHQLVKRKILLIFGKVLYLWKYTGARGKSGSNDASAEYMAHLRKIMDDAKISYQTAELGKVDVGGGGAIAYILANYGMNVIDSGVGVQNMHAPYTRLSAKWIYMKH